jgi:hypothetical protein
LAASQVLFEACDAAYVAKRLRRHAYYFLEHLLQMVRTQAGNIRESSERHHLLQMRLDVLEHGLNASLGWRE